jgi:hypothetical protein
MTGVNYKIINEEIEKLAQQMIRIAVDFATESANKTATQVEKESVESESKLTDYATEIEEAINKGFELMQPYSEAALGENRVAVNKDYDSAILTPEQVASYVSLYVQEIISLDKLLSMLMQGEYIPMMDEKELDTEKTLIRNGGGVV